MAVKRDDSMQTARSGLFHLFIVILNLDQRFVVGGSGEMEKREIFKRLLGDSGICEGFSSDFSATVGERYDQMVRCEMFISTVA